MDCWGNFASDFAHKRRVIKGNVDSTLASIVIDNSHFEILRNGWISLTDEPRGDTG
jgi:hypothetical protein